ncbi:MAG: hypothetical protein ABIR78_08315 [Ferruginibacter sp.]
MKIILSLILFFIYSDSEGQLLLKKKKITKTQWATQYKDSLFFKSDTIRFVKVQNIDSLNLVDYFDEKDYAVLAFYKCKKLKILIINVDFWVVNHLYGKFKWAFNEVSQTLELFYKKTQFATFSPVSERSVEIKSQYKYEKPYRTTEISFLRIK